MGGLEDFKEWIAEDRKALPDIEVTIVDDIGDLKATQEGEILGLPASHERFDISDVRSFSF